MEKDLVYLVWTDVKTGNKYKVAELYKMHNTFYFKYILENLSLLYLYKIYFIVQKIDLLL